MKTQHYTCLLLLLILLFSSSVFAQRGRYRSGRDHYRYSYPQRNYSYSRPYVSAHFNNYNYGYHHGYFYRPYGSVFQVEFPQFGVRIATLPFGYRRFYIGPDPYYYYNGIYYRPYDDQYEVIAPPLGAVVDKLPRGAKVKVIDGQKYYELNGTYYQEQIDNNNELSYTVVGTDGVLNTGKANDEVISEPAIGDRINTLPEDSKPVVIRGEKLYTTPSGLYYKEVTEGNKVYYELVGK
jgi:hypothetical protein